MNTIQWTAAAVLAFCASVVQAQVARVEMHVIQSVTQSDQDFLTGKRGKPVTIAGALRIPRPGADRLLAVLLLHGSGGVGHNVVDWEEVIGSMGIATFVLDAFTGRGITSTSTDQAQLGRLAMTFDAYRALEVLEKHPRVDPQRVAVMGFSRGGQAALYAGLKRFQKLHGAASGRDFAAYVPFYPSCGTRFMEDEAFSPSPVHILHGAADNYVPVAACRSYVARLKSAGANVVLTEYEGAHHVFDGRMFRKPVIAAKSQTTRSCELAERAEGVVVNAKSGRPFNYADPCVELGPTIAYDEKAHAESVKAVRQFLGGMLLRM